jgi:opacity protein-like surface antigen
MKTAIKLLALAASVSVATLVHADAGMYAGANITQIGYKEDGFATVEPIAVAFKLGKQFSPNFALEGRIGLGVADDDIDVGGIPVSLEVDNYYGVYGKAILPLSETASVYGLLGFTRGKLTISANGFSQSDSDSDLSFGLGAEFTVAPTAFVSVEWARLLKGDDYKVNGISLGIGFKF